MKKLTTKGLCLSAVIAGLYAVLTYVFLPLAFGPIQIRPAEALCLLPLLYKEAIPALAIGCFLSNLSSPYLFYDLIFGTLITLISALLSYLVGSFFKKEGWKLFFGGIFPVLLNAIFLPFIILFIYGETEASFIAYLTQALSILITQSLWVYALGIPLYLSVKRLQKKNAFIFFK